MRESIVFYNQELEKRQNVHGSLECSQLEASDEDMDTEPASMSMSNNESDDDKIQRSDVAEMMPSDLSDSASVTEPVAGSILNNAHRPLVDYGLSNDSLPAVDNVSVETVSSLTVESTVSAADSIVSAADSVVRAADSIVETNLASFREINEINKGGFDDGTKIEQPGTTTKKDLSTTTTNGVSGATTTAGSYMKSNAEFAAGNTTPVMTQNAYVSSMNGAVVYSDTLVATVLNHPVVASTSTESTLSYVDGHANTSLDSIVTGENDANERHQSASQTGDHDDDDDDDDDDDVDNAKDDADDAASMEGNVSGRDTPNPLDSQLDDSSSSVTTSSSYSISTVE